MLVLEVFLYLLLGSVVVAFVFGLWRFLTREPELVRLVPAHTDPIAPASSTAAPEPLRLVQPPLAVEPAPAPAEPRSRLTQQIDAAFRLLEGDSPEAVIVLATAARHDQGGFVRVPALVRSLIGLGRSTDGARRCIVGMQERGVLELFADDSDATRSSEHLCPRALDGRLLGIARVRVEVIEQPVNVVTVAPSSAHVVVHAAGDEEPELHHAAAGQSQTSCGLLIGSVAAGLVGGSSARPWTTHGPSATCQACRGALQLPDERTAEEDPATLVMESSRVPPSARTLVSGYVGLR